MVSTNRRHARTFLLVNLHLGVHVDGEDDDVADNVESAHAHEDLRVFKGNFLRRLHHHEDDDEVGAVVSISVQCSMTGFREAQRVSRAAAAGVGDGHLRVHGGGGIEWCSAACEEVVGGSGREVRWFSQDGERVERVGSGSVVKMVGARPRGDGRLPPRLSTKPRCCFQRTRRVGGSSCAIYLWLWPIRFTSR